MQQSPGSGFSTTAQDGQSQKNWHASVGMVRSACVFPHSGHVTVDCRMIVLVLFMPPSGLPLINFADYARAVVIPDRPPK